MNVAELAPRRHQSLPCWPGETFERVTDALAAVLVAAYRRAHEPVLESLKPRGWA